MDSEPYRGSWGTDASRVLTSAEATSRLDTVGPNRLKSNPRVPRGASCSPSSPTPWCICASWRLRFHSLAGSSRGPRESLAAPRQDDSALPGRDRGGAHRTSRRVSPGAIRGETLPCTSPARVLQPRASTYYPTSLLSTPRCSTRYVTSPATASSPPAPTAPPRCSENVSPGSARLADDRTAGLADIESCDTAAIAEMHLYGGPHRGPVGAQPFAD